MKTSKILIALLLAVCALTVAAFAADTSITFTLAEDPDDDAVLDLTANVIANKPIQTFREEFTFDNTVLKLFDGYEWDVFTDSSDASSIVFRREYKKGKSTYSYGFPSAPKITVDGTKTTVVVELFTVDSDKFTYSAGFDICDVFLQFVDGKGFDDVTEDTFKFESAAIGTEDGVFGYNFGTADDTKFEFTADFIKEGGGDVILPINESDVDLRVSGDEATSGIRFKADFQTAYRVEGNELGYIASVDKEKNYTDGALVLDFAAVEAGHAAKGIAYGNGKDICWRVDGETTVITVALLGTPMTKEALQIPVAVRAYQIIGGTTYYANDVMKSTPYDVAKAIKTAGGEAYTKNQAYVDKIIDTVEGTADPTAIVLDISALFE